MLEAAFCTPFKVLEDRNANEPGRWSLMLAGSAFDVPAKFATADETVDVKLYNLLPVPTADVPIDKILNFKAKREPELDALRAEMDDLYQKVRGGELNGIEPSASSVRENAAG